MPHAVREPKTIINKTPRPPTPAETFRSQNSNLSSAEYVGRARAAEMLDVSLQMIDKLIRRGELRAFRLGTRVLVRRAELFRLVEAGEIGG